MSERRSATAATVIALLLAGAAICQADFRKVDGSSFFYGPASTAVNEGIASAFINPAGLYNILNTELLLNFDSLFSCGTLAAGHYFHGFGNMAIAGFDDEQQQRRTAALAWAGKFAGVEKGSYRHVFVFGFNVEANFSAPAEGVSFSANPGFLYLMRSDEKGLRSLAIGISSAWLFDRQSQAIWQAGISLTFRILKQKDFTMAVGWDFVPPFSQRAWNFGLELEILRPVYFCIGGGNDVLSAALNIKWTEDALYFTGIYDYTRQSGTAMVTYRRLVPEKVRSELPRRKGAKQVRQTKRVQSNGPRTSVIPVTEEMLQRQKDLLQDGLNHYAENELYPAIECWKKAVEISTNTDYGRQAHGYIDVSEAEIKGLRSK